ncbi:MAG: polyprenyl synthetase family protein [Sulfuricella sp.]|nr:polyprenyl synthetase family protein [Sulfuricella sp.]
MTDFQAWAATLQQRIEGVLSQVLPQPAVAPQRLHQAMRYVALGGGKRVRPLLAYAAGELTDADPQRVDAVAAAVELIHAYSLTHDDLPCMDDDSLRRGKPTCHVEYDEATALLVGDGLQALAFQTLAAKPLTDDSAVQIEMIGLLAAASGSRGMVGGQAIDGESVGKSLSLPELEFMHIHKTGALIRASVQLGALCGQALDGAGMERLLHFAKCIGLAFQVVDDILDAESTTATLGKTAGKDAEANKPTYVTILGANKARDFAAELHQDAMHSLEQFGERAERLRQIADFIVKRQF